MGAVARECNLAVVEALAQEGVAAREWEVDPVLVVAGVRELVWEV